MNREACFFCGQPVGLVRGALQVGGVEKIFHTGLMKDCKNEYLKWCTQQAARTQLLTSAVKVAGFTH